MKWILILELSAAFKYLGFEAGDDGSRSPGWPRFLQSLSRCICGGLEVRSWLISLSWKQLKMVNWTEMVTDQRGMLSRPRPI
jgi:hypothetical protein